MVKIMANAQTNSSFSLPHLVEYVDCLLMRDRVVVTQWPHKPVTAVRIRFPQYIRVEQWIACCFAKADFEGSIPFTDILQNA